MLSVIVYAIYIAVQVGACKFITNSKLQSELGADIYASIVVPADTVIDAVKKYLSNSASTEVFFRSHPTLSERVKNIETYLSQNNEAMPEVDEGKTDTNYFSWALRQLYLIYFRPSQFHREVEGPKKNQPKLTQAQRYVYVIKMLPWIILLAHINNLIIGSFWDITSIGYRWDLSWIVVEIGVAVGLFIGFGMAENDISVSVTSGITYGYLAGTFFILIVLFHLFAFLAALLGFLAGSLMGILGDHMDKDDSGKNDPVESLGQSILIGIGGGIMLGIYPAIANAVMAGLAFIFNGDFWSVFKAFGQSYLAFGITYCFFFYLVYLRLL